MTISISSGVGSLSTDEVRLSRIMDQLSNEDQGYNDLRVDLDAVLRKKGGRWYPFIPRFFIRYLKRVVHQDGLNKILREAGDKQGLSFIHDALINQLGIEIELVHPENIPGEGRFIVASNHPLGGLDGMALMHAVGSRRSDIQFLANDILLELKPLAPLFAPVNKIGRNSRESIALLDTLYASDQLILIFPAGLVSRRQRGRIADLEWKKSFISKAIQHKRDVVPVYIEGRNSDFFYRLANIRKLLRIKANIEMLYLVDELFRQQNQTIRIHFGKPVSWTRFTDGQSHYDWAQQMKALVYRLAEGVDAEPQSSPE